MSDPLKSYPTDSRYDPDKKPFRGGPLGESKKILRLYARDRRRERIWRILLAIKWSYVLIPTFTILMLIITAQSIELDNADYQTGPISLMNLSRDDFSINVDMKQFVIRNVKSIDLKCPPETMSAPDRRLWQRYNTMNHRRPFDQAGPGCTIR